MKKFFLSLAACFLIIGISDAQFTKIGGGLVFGTGTYFENISEDYYQTGKPGLNITGIYEISVPIHIAPSVSLFLPQVTKWGTGADKYIISTFMCDLNGHYIFNSLSRFEFYGLAGMNFTLIKWTDVRDYGNDGIRKTSLSETPLGLNLGAGTYMKFSNQFEFFGELKYIVSSRDQFVISAGVLLNLDWLKKHETRAF